MPVFAWPPRDSRVRPTLRAPPGAAVLSVNGGRSKAPRDVNLRVSGSSPSQDADAATLRQKGRPTDHGLRSVGPPTRHRPMISILGATLNRADPGSAGSSAAGDRP